MRRRRMMQRRQHGFMAIVLVVFLVIFVIMAASIVSMTTSGARGAADHVNASAALFIAESGIEWAARELFDTDDPPTDCAALEDQGSTVNEEGSFTIIDAEYQPDTESCRVTSRGLVNPASRTLVGVIPRRILDGETGGGDDLFDDEDNWNAVGGGNEIIDGVLYIRQQGSDTARAQDGSGALSDDFDAGDRVYFAANVDPHAVGLTVTLTFPGPPGNYATCAGNQACANIDPGDPGYELLDFYNTVFLLDASVSGSRDNVNQIVMEVDFTQYGVDEVAIANGCIGRWQHCLQAGSDDPTDGGGWDENP